MRKNENAVNSPEKGLVSQNSMQNILPEALSLHSFQPTSVANTNSALGTSWVKQAVSTNSKVPIPRHRPSTAPRYNHRVPRACESCRQRKTKCSGDTPVCQQCQTSKGTCLYPLASTEKLKKQVKKLSEKAQDYENMLKDLGNLVDTRTTERITNLLSKVRYDSVAEDAPSSHSVTLHDELPNEPSSPSSIGSLEEIDRVEEDLNRNKISRATGFMGKSSEVTWMQRLQREAKRHVQGSSSSLEHGQGKLQNDLALHTVNYHLDEMGISIPEPMEIYAIPPRQLADRLLDEYLRTVHPSFPIIRQTLFTAQYRTFFDSNEHPGDKWLAILNMIFAIGAQHASLIRASWRGADGDHVTYLARARILSMSGHELFNHPDFQQVQVEGLIAFYLLSSGQINRAWRISALAVRSAVALGINMKNSSPTTPNIDKEARYRVWWCLYTFEHLLGIMTGRATYILDNICTTPLPLPFEDNELSNPVAADILNDTQLRDECINNVMASASVRHIPLNPLKGTKTSHLAHVYDSSWVKSLPLSSSLCYLYYCDLALIVQEVVNRVYSTDCVMEPWAHILNRIGELRVRIDLWYQSLPENFKFSERKDGRPDLLRSKLALNLHYFSARITLGRPCLCRRDAQRESSANRSAFSREMAELTLQSAKLMLELISDEPNVIELYEISPWWCILHYLMQAATVILLKMSFWSDKIPEEETHFVIYAKKSMRWLYAMSAHSIASQRAWQLCDISLRRIAAGVGFNVDDMPSAFECQPTPTATLAPKHYSSQRFQSGSTELWDSFLNDPYLASPDVPSTGPTASVMADLHLSNDLYFPYDPINGEFIRSFFPHSGEDSKEMMEEGW
ncbi:transcriptional regulator family: Fungal Specific TF [Penicillium longicatenatum]|uniref:transcriptional regulator family: Fungal Specific TF n=1 Tax=Penicillium longicatenatum TaxID=1561947 RepID=UPI0025474A50|nr:transcriptional regulator family: Fungal Specific TF [Penicillium longicatenatum]KAJ5644225.1 transcriptional regulator family: Fungal Specific TF [Penicillium longicatenatum]